MMKSFIVEVAMVGELTRFETSFLLPDGSSIDLFFRPKDGVVTDLGETIRWIWTCAAGRILEVEAATRLFPRVHRENGTFFVKCDLTSKFDPKADLEALECDLFQLGQFCLYFAIYNTIQPV